MSIYGFGDIRVGEPIPAGLDYPVGTPGGECSVAYGIWPGASIELVPEPGGNVVAAISIRTGDFSTPSGLRVGSTVADVLDRLGNQIVVISQGAAGADATAAEDISALDFVPIDPEEADLRLRFVIEDGEVREMRAGRQEVVDGSIACSPA